MQVKYKFILKFVLELHSKNGTRSLILVVLFFFFGIGNLIRAQLIGTWNSAVKRNNTKCMKNHRVCLCWSTDEVFTRNFIFTYFINNGLVENKSLAYSWKINNLFFRTSGNYKHSPYLICFIPSSVKRCFNSETSITNYKWVSHQKLKVELCVSLKYNIKYFHILFFTFIMMVIPVIVAELNIVLQIFGRDTSLFNCFKNGWILIACLEIKKG